MKKILFFAATAVINFSALTGCKKSDSSPSYSMKATIGSTSFNTSHCLAVAASGGLTITGWSGTSTTATAPMIDIVIVNWNQSTGTITFDSTMTTGYEQYLPNTTTTSLEKTGTVTITSVATNSVSGTFSFTASDGTVVSAGSFTAQK